MSKEWLWSKQEEWGGKRRVNWLHQVVSESTGIREWQPNGLHTKSADG